MLTVKHQTLDLVQLGYEGDTIELLRVNGFWYENLRVSQEVEGWDDEHRIQLYLPRCSDVEIYEKSSHYVSPYHKDSVKSRQMGVMLYVYLLSGSSVSYSFCMKSMNESVDTSGTMFFIFNDRAKYVEYVYREGNGKKTSIFQKKLSVARSDQSAICSTFTFTAKKSNYYFMAGQCSGGISYQYNVTLNTKFLNFRDYKENKSCSALTAKHDCEISVGTQFLSKSEKYCLLAHIIPRSKGDRRKMSPTTHLRVTAGKRGEVVAIPVIVIVVGVVGLLVVVVTYCCCCCKKCCWGQRLRSRQYTLISV